MFWNVFFKCQKRKQESHGSAMVHASTHASTRYLPSIQGKPQSTRKSFSGSLILVTLNLVLSAATCGTEYHVSFTSSAAEAATASSNWSSSSLSWHASTCLIILISFAAFREAAEMQCEVIKFWPGALVRLFSLQTAPLETSECEEATKRKEAAEATMIIEPVVMKDLSTERWSIRSIQVIYGNICCQGSFWWPASAYPGALESSTTSQRNANAWRIKDHQRLVSSTEAIHDWRKFVAELRSTFSVEATDCHLLCRLNPGRRTLSQRNIKTWNFEQLGRRGGWSPGEAQLTMTNQLQRLTAHQEQVVCAGASPRLSLWVVKGDSVTHHVWTIPLQEDGRTLPNDISTFCIDGVATVLLPISRFMWKVFIMPYLFASDCQRVCQSATRPTSSFKGLQRTSKTAGEFTDIQV